MGEGRGDKKNGVVQVRGDKVKAAEIKKWRGTGPRGKGTASVLDGYMQMNAVDSARRLRLRGARLAVEIWVFLWARSTSMASDTLVDRSMM